MAVNNDSERDPGLDRLYGAAPRAEPPARLDAAIQAAARREVGARPRPLASLRRWRVPVSIAAVLVLSASLVMLMKEEGGENLMMDRSFRGFGGSTAPDQPPTPAPPGERNAPAPADSAPERAKRSPVAPAESSISGDSAKRDTARGLEPPAGAASGRPRLDQPASRSGPEAKEERPRAPLAAADDGRAGAAASAERSSPAPAPSPAEMASGAAMGRPGTVPEARQERDVAAAPESPPKAAAAPPPDLAKAAPPPPQARAAAKPMMKEAQRSDERYGEPAPLPGVAVLVKELDKQPPEKWLERIQDLRRQGRLAEAEELAAEFKRRFPAYRLPSGLQ
jgi:hypothetical protein